MTTDQRNRILQAVRETVAEHGYANSTVMEIIIRAGISSKTFYKHFSDKLEAFRALMQITAEYTIAHIDSSLDAKVPWPERVYASLECLISIVAEHPQTARLGIVEIQAAGPEALTDYQHWLRQYATSLAPTTTEAFGRLPSRPGIADQTAGAISQLLYDSIVGNRISELPKLLPELVEIALAPYMGPQRAAKFVAQRAVQSHSLVYANDLPSL